MREYNCQERRVSENEIAEQFARSDSAHTSVGSELVCASQKGLLRGQTGTG
jgi:hypothetical protein